MSNVEVRAGSIKKINIPNEKELSFIDKCNWILYNVVDFYWQSVDEENEFVEWEKNINKVEVTEAVVFIKGAFYHVHYEFYNDNLYMDCFHVLPNGDKFFSMVYYNGGTYFEEVLERHLKKY